MDADDRGETTAAEDTLDVGPAPGAVPAEIGRFVGRLPEVRAIKHLISRSRLVTLTGPGGVGKTRLAQRVARDLIGTFPNGATFVDLAELRNPQPPVQPFDGLQEVAETVAATLGVWERPSLPPLTLLGEYLGRRRLLLVLDNCEHLLPAVAVVAETLLRTCPELRILATSREPLGIFGESAYPVSPLAVPHPAEQPALTELRRWESVRLFLDRAQAAMPSFELTERNQAAVAEICRRLDGLPLAIELAAVWVRVLSPEQIVDRLSDPFTLLLRGSSTAPDRQQTLRSSLDWSYRMCTPQEQQLWARLSVFCGSFEMDGVRTVCAGEELAGDDLVPLLAALVDRSIVVRDHDDAVAPYRLLATVRAYGEEKLRESGSYPLIRRRHRDWCEQFLRRARDEWLTDRQAYWMSRLDRERATLRSAVEFSLADPREVESVLRMVLAVPMSYWSSHGLFGVARGWLDAALARVTEPTVLRARALLLSGFLAVLQGELAEGLRRIDDGESLSRSLGVDATAAFGGYVRGVRDAIRGDLASGLTLLQRAASLVATAGEEETLFGLEAAIALGSVAVLADDGERATAVFKQVIEFTEPRGEVLYRSKAIWGLGLLAWREDDLAPAASSVSEALRLIADSRLDDQFGIALCLEILAWIAAAQGESQRAAALFGAADATWTDIGTPLGALPPLARCRQTYESRVRADLDAAQFEQAVRRGGRLSRTDRIGYALAERPDPPPEADGSALLTRREMQVATLVAQGLTNREIARTLVISQRTAESHVENILMKLSFTSRAQIAAWAARLTGRGEHLQGPADAAADRR